MSKYFKMITDPQKLDVMKKFALIKFCNRKHQAPKSGRTPQIESADR